MKVIYLGPVSGSGNQVIVAPYGRHWKDKVKEYPDDFAEELLATSKKQHFEAAKDDIGIHDVEIAMQEEGSTALREHGLDLQEWTVKELTAELEKRGIEIPKKARKAELIDLLAISYQPSTVS